MDDPATRPAPASGSRRPPCGPAPGPAASADATSAPGVAAGGGASAAAAGRGGPGPEPARAVPAEPSSRRPGLVLLGVMLGLFLAAMESTAVATAMPTVVAALGGLSLYSWVFSGYILAGTLTMPLWGRAADLYGRRAAYLVGLAVFLLGSVLSGLARSMTALIVFRTVQGLGGGALIPLGMTIIADLYGLERRARMQGYFSATWGVASIVGPLIGGFLTDHLSWRWVFFVNLPFGLLAGALLARALAGTGARRGPTAVDLPGAVLLTAGMGAFLVGLAELGRGGVGAQALALTVAGLGLLAGFALWERRAPEPLFPLRLFRNPVFRAGAAAGFLAGMAMFGTISFIPLFVQGVIGGSATEAGSVLTPFVLGWVTCSVVSARLSLRVGYRWPVLGGMVCLALAFLLMTRMDATTSHAAASRNMLVAGVGMGLAMVPLLLAVQNAVPRRDLGAATSATTFFRAIGGAVGVALMGAVLAAGLTGRLAALDRAGAALPPAGLQSLLAHPDVFIHPALRQTLPLPLLQALSQGLAQALHRVFQVGLAVACLAVASAFLVPPGRARDLVLREELGESPAP